MSIAKNWLFTINNPTDEDQIRLTSLKDEANVQYFIYQLEQGDEGTPHFQGKSCG